MIMCHWDPNNTQPKNDAQVNNKGSGKPQKYKKNIKRKSPYCPLAGPCEYT